MTSAATMGLVVIAHQGGWDEMLMVLVPIGIFAWLLSVANKRATRQLEARGDGPAADGAPGDGPGRPAQGEGPGPDGAPDRGNRPPAGP